MVPDGIGRADDLLNGQLRLIKFNLHHLLLITGGDALYARKLVFQAFKVHGAVGTFHIRDAESYSHFLIPVKESYYLSNTNWPVYMPIEQE